LAWMLLTNLAVMLSVRLLSGRLEEQCEIVLDAHILAVAYDAGNSAHVFVQLTRHYENVIVIIVFVPDYEFTAKFKRNQTITATS